MPTPALAWNTILAFPKIIVANDNVNTGPISVPKNIYTITVSVTTLDAAATYKVQVIDPVDQVTWFDVYQINAFSTPLQQVIVAGLISGRANTMDAIMFGGGIIRFVASAAQVTDKTFSVRFGMMA
jgi:hypothetical protein